MKVLIIGYGSIGRRHDEVLSRFDDVLSIDLVTKQNVKDRQTFLSLEKVKDITLYDYFIIASETKKHYEQLVFLDSKISNKIIFCEKPLFEQNKTIKIKNNAVYIGYVLRYHPLLKKLKQLLKDQIILSANISCGQYLPTWRQNIDYRDSYSAKKDEGGGVLLDLSHEIDYIQWLFGSLVDIKSYQKKISDLEITSDDYTTFLGRTDENIFVNATIDYISKIEHRSMHINTLEYSYDLDFLRNTLTNKNKKGLEEIHTFSNLEKNYMFEAMHLDILGDQEDICKLEEAMKVMETISIIQEQNYE
jgi:CMP-N,N'-diacetyllegionaminic acid synthase